MRIRNKLELEVGEEVDEILKIEKCAECWRKGLD